MRVRVHYADGCDEEFDTGALTSASPLGKGNAMSDFELSVRDDGLWVETSWYAVSPQGGLARRSPGCSIHLLSAEELARVETVWTSDTVLMRRIGPDLMDMARFEQALALFYEPDEYARSSVAARAERLLSILRARFPHDDETKLLARMGLTESSFRIMSGADVSVDGGRVFIEEGWA